MYDSTDIAYVHNDGEENAFSFGGTGFQRFVNTDWPSEAKTDQHTSFKDRHAYSSFLCDMDRNNRFISQFRAYCSTTKGSCPTKLKKQTCNGEAASLFLSSHFKFAAAQSFLKRAIPASVSGCWNILLSTSKGTVAMSAPALAHSVTWIVVRMLAAMISVLML